MTELHDHDDDIPTPPTKRKRALFWAFLILASSLIYLEMIARHSN